MGLPVREQALYWSIATVVFLAALWLLGGILLPFIIGGAIAYFLDPLADRLEEAGLSRGAATVLISMVAVLIFIVLAVLVVPTLVRQLLALINSAPAILNQLQSFLTHQFPQILDKTSIIHETLVQFGKTIQSQGADLANRLIASALTVINAALFIVVVPVVAFYLLLDWDRMIGHVDRWLPRDHADTIRQIGREIDHALAGFVRGQLTVCGILGTYYAVGLMLVGLQFGLIVGAIAGLITFIPYLGAMTGGALAIGLALFQFWGEPSFIAAVIIIFAFGQFVEGNILSPNLVGHSVGLHPVWLLFALSAFGALFGFVGLLVAVPVAATLGVLARFALRKYLASELYRGTRSDGGASPPPSDAAWPADPGLDPAAQEAARGEGPGRPGSPRTAGDGGR